MNKVSIYNKPYIPILLTVSNDTSMKNVIVKSVKSLVKWTEQLTTVGILISLNMTLLFTVHKNDCLALAFNYFLVLQFFNRAKETNI